MELDWHEQFGDKEKKIENLLSSAPVIHWTAKQVIPHSIVNLKGGAENG